MTPRHRAHIDALAARKRKQTHCLNGHRFTPKNTRYRADRYGRLCRTCDRDRNFYYRAAQKRLAA